MGIRPGKRLLVNADDFGLSSAIDEGIVTSHLSGIVRSTSIVAAGAAFDNAVELARHHASLDVGVHLTLVEENAVASPLLLGALAPDGLLPKTYGALMNALVFARIHLANVECEFRAQIEKCLAAGLKLTHLDSHQHTHAFPPIFSLAARLGKEYSIPGIRIPRGNPRFSDISAARFLPKCVLSLLAHGDATFLPRSQRITTRYFGGLFETGALTEQAALRILERLKPGTTELVCHPGAAEPYGRYSSWNERRQLELSTLTSPRVTEAIGRLGIELIGYRQLCDDSDNTAGSPA